MKRWMWVALIGIAMTTVFVIRDPRRAIRDYNARFAEWHQRCDPVISSETSGADAHATCLRDLDDLQQYAHRKGWR